MMFIVDEPRRGATEAALQGEFARADFAYAESITWYQLKRVLRIPTNLYMILQGLPGEFCTASLDTYNVSSHACCTWSPPESGISGEPL